MLSATRRAAAPASPAHTRPGSPGLPSGAGVRVSGPLAGEEAVFRGPVGPCEREGRAASGPLLSLSCRVSGAAFGDTGPFSLINTVHKGFRICTTPQFHRRKALLI